MVEHRSLVNLVTWHKISFDLQASDRTAATAGVAFDASAWEFWGALSNGCSLLLPPNNINNDISASLKWWHSQALSVTFLTTSLVAGVLVNDLKNSTLRYLLTGGDRLNSSGLQLSADFILVNN